MSALKVDKRIPSSRTVQVTVIPETEAMALTTRQAKIESD
jgi:hypothetical protein